MTDLSDETKISLNVNKTHPVVRNEQADDTLQGSLLPSTHSQETVFTSGEVLDGKYKIISLLGTGGMGKVYRIQHLYLRKEFALKVLDLHGTADETTMRRFQLEARATNSLSHPNLVKVHEFGVLNEHQPYLVMDLVDGISLSDYIKEKGPLTAAEACAIFIQACEGLEYAHQQSVIHRDIKPSNIMLIPGREASEATSVKIVDFGIAKIANIEGGEIQSLTRTGEVFGSPLYMSPEQCSGDLVDRRTDIYSLGCALFEALTGTPPHMGQNALRTMMLHQTTPPPTLKEASMGNSFPAALEDTVQKMLAKEPENRQSSLAQVAQDLKHASTAHNNSTGAKPVQNRAGKFSRYTKSRLVIFALILAALPISYYGITQILRNTGPSPDQEKQTSTIPVKPNKNTSDERESLDGVIASVNQSNDMSDQFRRDIEDSPEIGSTLSHDYGSNATMRTILFPDWDVGKFCENYNFDFDENTKRAQGRVFLKRDAKPALMLDTKKLPLIGMTPLYLSKIAPREFFALKIKGNFAKTLDLAVSDGTTMADKKAVTESLSILKKWSNLQSLSLENVPLDEESIVAIMQIPNLHKIQIDMCSVDLSRFDNAFAQKLVSISITHQPQSNIDEFVKRLSNSVNLYSLNEVGCNISEQSVIALKSSKIEGLLLEEKRYTDGMIAAIVQLPNLKGVSLRLSGQGSGTPTASLSVKQIRRLLACSKLKQIITTPLLSEVAREVLKEGGGRIKIVRK